MLALTAPGLRRGGVAGPEAMLAGVVPMGLETGCRGDWEGAGGVMRMSSTGPNQGSCKMPACWMGDELERGDRARAWKDEWVEREGEKTMPLGNRKKAQGFAYHNAIRMEHNQAPQQLKLEEVSTGGWSMSTAASKKDVYLRHTGTL